MLLEKIEQTKNALREEIKELLAHENAVKTCVKRYLEHHMQHGNLPFIV